MDAAERKDILSRYLDHARRFDEAAARRSGPEQDAEVIPFTAPLRELDSVPAAVHRRGTGESALQGNEGADT